MSGTPENYPMGQQPPPYEQATNPPSGQTTYPPKGPPSYPPSGPPQFDPSYGYDQRPAYPGVNQTTTNVVQVQPAAPTTIIVSRAVSPARNMYQYRLMSCLVFWFCNALFGAIAYFVAIAGSSAETEEEARQYKRASLGLNIAGIVSGIVTIAVMAALWHQNYFYYY